MYNKFALLPVSKFVHTVVQISKLLYTLVHNYSDFCLHQPLKSHPICVTWPQESCPCVNVTQSLNCVMSLRILCIVLKIQSTVPSNSVCCPWVMCVVALNYMCYPWFLCNVPPNSMHCPQKLHTALFNYMFVFWNSMHYPQILWASPWNMCASPQNLCDAPWNLCWFHLILCASTMKFSL